MTTCRECASEISETEAFCPYCGIKIERAFEASPIEEPVVVDNSLDNTIMMSPSEALRLQKDATESAEDPTSAQPSPFDGPSATSRTAPTLEDIPTPAILSGGFARPTDPEISIASEATPTKESPVFDESVFASEPAPEEIPAFEPIEREVENAGTASAVEGENLTEPSYELAALPESITGRPEDAAAGSGVSSVDPEAAPVPVDEPVSISKPLAELEEPVVTPSVFDSVRIMEGGAPSPDNIDTIIPGHSFKMPPVISRSEPEKAPEPAPALESAGLAKTSGTGLGKGDTDGRRSAKLKQLPEGTVLNNRYEIVRKIGGGGMGAVYLASDNNLGGVLRAVKEMVQAHIEEDQQEKAVNDFKRESMILSTLDHPSIPTIYDYFYDAEEGRFYLVMKYISGGDLASKLRSSADGKVEELIVTEWAIQLTDVLNYLHNQPSTIVYRDLKPSNIMLDGNSGRVMLIDFGIARNISQKEEKGVTAVGTMGYAPPELFSGNVEPRSDIYSLGSTLFHLLTGADPQSNPLLIFDFQKNPRPRQINSRLSDQMERILMRMVEYNAEQRFSSAAELKAVLEEHLANLRSGNLTFGVTEAPVSVSLANQSVFCGFCGQRIVATDLFCAFCGAQQPIAQQGVHSEIYHRASATARLVIEGTSELSAPIYALQKDDNLIGRRDPMSNIFPEVDLSKYDPQTKISRRHAKIWRDGTAFMLEDLGSSNGTVVEGPAAKVLRLPAHQPYKLASGDRIKIGDTRLHFVVG
jgi:eukaryotic-like serine/threonine-protein kinase